MKRSIFTLIFIICIAISFTSFSNCLKQEISGTIPHELMGTWFAEEVNITTREKTGFLKFEFYKGTGDIKIQIREDGGIEGNIGNHYFTEGKFVKKNINIIIIENTGNLFPDDLSPIQEVSFWLHEYNENEIMAELRLTQNGGKFPMAGVILRRI